MSADTPLGVPYNIVSYSVLTRMIAQSTNMLPGKLHWSGGDVHIYKNQIEGVKEQLTRTPKEAPTLKINPSVKNIFEFDIEDFEVTNYDPAPAISFKVAI